MFSQYAFFNVFFKEKNLEQNIINNKIFILKLYC